jgi:hypothetical protein
VKREKKEEEEVKHGEEYEKGDRQRLKHEIDNSNTVKVMVELQKYRIEELEIEDEIVKKFQSHGKIYWDMCEDLKNKIHLLESNANSDIIDDKLIFELENIENKDYMKQLENGETEIKQLLHSLREISSKSKKSEIFLSKKPTLKVF